MSKKAAPTRIQRAGNGHSYFLESKKVPGVTTVLSNGIPKPLLVNWSAKETASFVVNRLTVDPDGSISADELVKDALEWNRTRNRPEKVGNDTLDRLALTNILKDIRYRDLDQASGKGTAVHGFAEALARGEEVHPPPELEGHVQSYLNFLNSWEPQNALLERVVISRRWKYMGKLDLIAEFPGKVWDDGTPVGRGLLDIKTSRSGIFPDTGLQLAGYGFAETMIDGDGEIPVPEIDWYGAIHVRGDGFDVYRFDITEIEHRIFLYAKQIGEWADWKEGRELEDPQRITPSSTNGGSIMSEIERYQNTSSIELAPKAWSLAHKIAQTDFVPQALRGKPEAVLACILAGHEAGISPMQALAKIHIIEGRPAMSSELMRALVLRAGHEFWIEEQSSTRVIVGGSRKGQTRETKITWTLDDAKRAGLDGRQNWRKYPRAMLTARATADLCRAVFPDVLAGISHTIEELTDGDLVDGEIYEPEEIVPEPVAPKKGTGMKAKHTAAAASVPDEPEPVAVEPDELPPLPPADESDIVEAELVEDFPEPEADFPEQEAPSEESGPTRTGPQAIAMELARFGITARDDRLKAVCAIIAREVESSKDLTPDEVSTVLQTLRDLPDGTILVTPEQVEPEEPEVAPAPQESPQTTNPEEWNADGWRKLLKKRKVKVTELLREAHSLGANIGTLDELAGSGICVQLVGFVEDLSLERGS